METNNISTENEKINDIDTNATNAEQLKEIINNIPDKDLETLSKIDLESVDSESLKNVAAGLDSKTLKYAAIAAALTTAGLTGTAGYFAGKKLTKVDEDKEYENLFDQKKAEGIRDGYAAGIMIDTLGDKEDKDKFDRLYNQSTGKRKKSIAHAKDYLEKQMNDK